MHHTQKLLACTIALNATLALATPNQTFITRTSVRPAPSAAAPSQQTSAAEARLLEVYRLMGRGQLRQALQQAHQLATDYPNFQLAQLVYADLLGARVKPQQAQVQVSNTLTKSTPPQLLNLREEFQRRVTATKDRPPTGTVPSHFLALSQRSKHAIAVDASKSRLYLFENSPGGLQLIADYYVSVGKAGISKNVEGDQRTPLGVYYITSNLDRKSLQDFYGAGALPLNYPNVLDTRRGKTGSGIWLHGTPSNQFARAPQATDGCVVLANPDMEYIMRTVEVQTTPVVIAKQLRWIEPSSIRIESEPFRDALQAWRNAKASGDLNHVLKFYSRDFSANGKTLTQWKPTLQADVARVRGRDIELKDVSYLRWTDAADTMVVTFGEVASGSRSGQTKRQYWEREGGQWKIFYEGTL